MLRSVITGTGSYIPPVIQTNSNFAQHLFYSEDRLPLTTPPAEVVEKFQQITGIEERRYASDDLSTADIGFEAAKKAGADVFISADFKYHDFFKAENSILLADIGHYESEVYTKDLLHDILKKNFTKFAFCLSKTDTNPIRYF